MKRYPLVTIVALFLLCALAISAANVDQKVIDSVHKNQKTSVIVLLKDVNVKDTSQISAKTGPNSKQSRDAVLSKLKVSTKNPKKTFSATNSDLELKQVYSSLNAFSGEITTEGLTKLQNDPLVDKVVSNEVRYISLVNSVPLINATRTWNLTVDGVAIDGSGQSVCVIDTGVDYTHSGLGGCTTASFLAGSCAKVPFGYDYANSDADPMDDHNHGTHVSGIIASTDATYKGVAPNAKIVAMKVCDASGSCWDSDVIAGIERCIDNATIYNISVISISLGGDQISSYCDSGSGAAYAPVINRAVGQNISVVIATGNTGNGYNNAVAGVAIPSCIKNSTRVTATDKSDNMASYAFRNSAFDILAAPGSSITSLKLGGETTTLSGTSMATPHVSGVIALLQQFSKAQLDRMLTPNELKSTLNSTGKLIDDTANSGMIILRVNVYAAILALDTVNPLLTFFSPTAENDSTINGSSLSIEIHASESIQNVILQWNGVNESMSGSGSNYTATKTGLKSGRYTYQVTAQDTVGNHGASELRTVIMQGKPKITFNYPVSGKENYISQPFTMNISVSDDDLISSANYSIMDLLGNKYQSSFRALNGILDFSFNDSVNVSDLLYSDGNYTLTVYTNDTLSDESIVAGTFIVDKTAPVVHSASISPTTVYSNNNVTFRVNLSDLHLSGGVLESNFSGTLVNYTLQQETGETYYYTLLSGNLSNQETLGYRFYAGDRAGNLNVTDLYSFTVQNRVPRSLNIVSPASGQVLEIGSSVSVSGNATDDDGDALTYSWNFGDDILPANGQSVSHTYNSTGNYTILLNVSDGYSSNSTTIQVLVNDTTVPSIITATYDSTVHLQRDKGQNVTVNGFDYSGILSMTLTSEGITIANSCTKEKTSWTCKWSWNNFSAGSRSFIVNVTDNFTISHVKSNSYSFTVQSCSDASKNGDEEGVDCDGSCTTACSSSSSSSSSSSGGGGGGGGGSGGNSNSANTASMESVAETSLDSEVEPVAEELVVPEPSKEITPETSEKNQVAEPAPVAAKGDTISIGNRLTGFFGKVIPKNLSFDFNAKRIAITVMSVVIVGLGSLYFFVLRE